MRAITIKNGLFKTIFEDKQVTAAAHFRFQCQYLTSKITKFVDDFFLIFKVNQSLVLDFNNR